MTSFTASNGSHGASEKNGKAQHYLFHLLQKLTFKDLVQVNGAMNFLLPLTAVEDMRLIRYAAVVMEITSQAILN